MKKINTARFTLQFILTVTILFLLQVTPFAQEDDTWPLPAPELEKGSLTDDEIRLIDLALESINATWSDMSFRKDYVDDPFRLDVAQKALDDPYSLVLWTYEWDEFLLEPKPASQIMLRAAIDLDSDLHNTVPLSPTLADIGRPMGFPLLSDTWDNALTDLDMAVALAQDRMDTVVLASLSEDTLSWIRWYLECEWTDNENIDPECPETEDYEPSQDYLDAIEEYDIDALMRTMRDMSTSVDSSVDSLLGSISDADFGQPFALQGNSGTILIGSVGDDTWYIDQWPTASIIIDPGGNDTYYGQVAVAGNFPDETNELATVFIDLDGDDTYFSDDKRSCASGVLGVAEFIDVAGDDVYRCGDFSIGAGLFGAAIFEDRGGKDIYEAGDLVQGAGAVGFGLLIDNSGNDSYRSNVYSQGFAFTRGWGMLSDRDGCDVYTSGGENQDFGRFGESAMSLSQGFSIGMRPSASGGVAILHDRNGNDFYNAEVYGQGVSYWYSIGALIDDNGSDWHNAEHYSMGSGIHLSSGILLDRGNGYDRYVSRGCTQGFGHDYAVGWFIDEGGDDYFMCHDIGQGVGLTNSVGVFVDRGGNDGYFSKGPTRYCGYGSLAREYGGIGIFIDMAGSDTYIEPNAGNGDWWTKSTWGAGIDVGADWWEIELDDEGVEISRTLKIPGMPSTSTR